MKTSIFSKVKGMVKVLLPLYLFTLLPLLSSCSDFFEQESNEVIYANQEHLNSAVDTVFSVVGILDKLQAVADRTLLLGEVRGDLVDITDVASADLRELAQFNADDDNIYNIPSDYYAIINNCNYYIAHADTAMKTNRNEYVFMKEFAAVKGIRAWTYLQLALIYGKVPFVTEPILTKEEADKSYPSYDIQQICDYFLNDLASIPEEYNTQYPGLRTLSNANVQSQLLFFPLSILRGELYLWRATLTGSKADYRSAAQNYYKYITERNGRNSTYPMGPAYITWTPGSATWNSWTSYNLTGSDAETVNETSELISMIAISSEYDSVPNPKYNRIRYLFNSREDNDYKVSLTPSLGLQEISEAQKFCCVGTNASSVSYAPAGLSDHQTGDLRLSQSWREGHVINRTTRELIETQTIRKFGSRNVHVYRRQMVYMRMAEALNMAGYPRFAYLILSEGISNEVIQNEVIPYYAKSDSAFLAGFDFPDNRYVVMNAEDFVRNSRTTVNMHGIHTRGSGWTPFNEYYYLVNDTLIADTIENADAKRQQLMAEQQVWVDSLLLNESALEFAFEGTRYYDLMRYALHQPNPEATLQQLVYARKGEANRQAMQSEIKRPLTDRKNWFLSWKGRLGL